MTEYVYSFACVNFTVYVNTNYMDLHSKDTGWYCKTEWPEASPNCSKVSPLRGTVGSDLRSKHYINCDLRSIVQYNHQFTISVTYSVGGKQSPVERADVAEMFVFFRKMAWYFLIPMEKNRFEGTIEYVIVIYMHIFRIQQRIEWTLNSHLYHLLTFGKHSKLNISFCEISFYKLYLDLC